MRRLSSLYILKGNSPLLKILTVAIGFCSLLFSPSSFAAPVSSSKNSCSSVLVKTKQMAPTSHDPKISKLGYELLVNNDIHAGSPVKIYKRTNGSLKYLKAIGGPLAERELNSNSLRQQRVLDVGTGAGATVRDLRRLDIDAEGIDMALSKDQLNKPFFRQERAEQMTFEDQRFDLTISSFSIFYYPELQHIRVQALAEMSRVTKSGGRILLIGFSGYSAKGENLAQNGRENTQFLGFHREIDYMNQLWSRSPRAIDAELSRLLNSLPDLQVDSVDYQRQVVVLKK